MRLAAQFRFLASHRFLVFAGGEQTCAGFRRKTNRPVSPQAKKNGAAHEMWHITASATTTSTAPMRPPTHFDGPARAVAHEMWFTTATTKTFFSVPGSLSAKNSYERTMHFRQIASGV